MTLRWALIVLLVGVLPRCSTPDASPSSPPATEAGAAGQAGNGEGGANGDVAGAPSAAGSDAQAGSDVGGAAQAGAGAASAGGAGGEAGAATVLLCEPPPYCTTNANCDWYEHCVDERCVAAPEGVACELFPEGSSGIVPDSAACGNAQYCRDGACANRPLYIPDISECLGGPPQAICPKGTECKWRPLYFPAETCQGVGPYLDPTPGRRCDDIGCPDALYCDFTTHDGPPTCELRGKLGESCSSGQQESCLPGLVCNFYKCQAAEAPAGSACEPNLYERHNGLNDVPVEYEPSLPRACAKGLYCKDTGQLDADENHLGKCTATNPIGSACEASWECTNAYCDASKHCTAPALNTECGCDGACWYTNGKCPDGTGCAQDGNESTKCVPALALGDMCTAGAVCPTGAKCISVNKTSICAKVAGAGEDCADATCLAGTSCVSMPAP